MIDPIGIGLSGMLGGINAYVGSMKKPEAISKPDEAQKLGGAYKSSDNGKNSLAVDEDADKKRRFDSFEECETCKNRKYQDQSDDNGVSFQTPTKVAPEAAAAAVRGHEQEHVVRNRQKAEREGDEIISQSVTLHTDICPECGKTFIAGGTTRTSYRRNAEQADKFNVGMNDSKKGEALDLAV